MMKFRWKGGESIWDGEYLFGIAWLKGYPKTSRRLCFGIGFLMIEINFVRGKRGT